MKGYDSLRSGSSLRDNVEECEEKESTLYAAKPRANAETALALRPQKMAQDEEESDVQSEELSDKVSELSRFQLIGKSSDVSPSALPGGRESEEG